MPLEVKVGGVYECDQGGVWHGISIWSGGVRCCMIKEGVAVVISGTLTTRQRLWKFRLDGAHIFGENRFLREILP